MKARKATNKMTTTPPTAIPTIGPVPSLDFEELELFASAPDVGELVAPDVTYCVCVDNT